MEKFSLIFEVDRMKPIAFLFAGQGSQKAEMFKELTHSENGNLKRSSEKVLDTLKGLGTEGSDIVDVYYNTDVDTVRINNTRNVQPALAAYLSILYMGLENELGHKLVPYVASGRSFGVIPSLCIR